jgi:E3 ubiquitin-protein ligase DOA10
MDVSDFLPNYAGTSKENQAAKPEGTEFSCRICLDSDYDSMTNPLISPCKCAGTMKYIHIRCL